MEGRQDSLEAKVLDLTTVVTRVEVNQNHALELNKLRFDTLDTSLKTLTSEVTAFMSRVTSLMTGETETALGARMLREYEEFRVSTANRLEAMETRALKIDTQSETRSRGILSAAAGVKSVLLILLAIASAAAAIIASRG
jgi:hypothetical protein